MTTVSVHIEDKTAELLRAEVGGTLETAAARVLESWRKSLEEHRREQEALDEEGAILREILNRPRQ